MQQELVEIPLVQTTQLHLIRCKLPKKQQTLLFLFPYFLTLSISNLISTNKEPAATVYYPENIDDLQKMYSRNNV